MTKTILVTGGTNGIGKGIVDYFLDKGWNVAAADIQHQGDLEESSRYLFIQTDVRKQKQIAHFIEEAEKKFGQIDVLVNNAGVSRFTPLEEMTEEEWNDVLQTNLSSVFFGSQEVAKKMKGRGGAIINIASTRASMSEPNSEAYAATKGGIVALTHALAASLADDKITVNAISPGWIETGDYSQLREIDHEQHLSKRVGKPVDVAKAVEYLADTENNFVNGINLTVDGGMTRKMIYEH